MPKTQDTKPDTKKASSLDAADRKELTALSRELKKVASLHEKLISQRRKKVHQLYRRKDGNITEMANIFGISRQALVKDINTLDKAAEERKAARAKAPAKATSKAASTRKSARKPVRRKVAS